MNYKKVFLNGIMKTESKSGQSKKMNLVQAGSTVSKQGLNRGSFHSQIWHWM